MKSVLKMPLPKGYHLLNDKIKGVLPRKHIDIFFEIKDDTRVITIKENV